MLNQVIQKSLFTTTLQTVTQQFAKEKHQLLTTQKMTLIILQVMQDFKLQSSLSLSSNSKRIENLAVVYASQLSFSTSCL